MALTANLITFRALFSEFAEIADEKIQFLLDLASEETNPSPCYQRAILYKAAFWLKLEKDNIDGEGGGIDGGIGSVSSASADGLSVSFTQPAQLSASLDNAYYGRNDYGQRYLQTIRDCADAARLTTWRHR